jgi:hypothetical protein
MSAQTRSSRYARSLSQRRLPPASPPRQHRARVPSTTWWAAPLIRGSTACWPSRVSTSCAVPVASLDGCSVCRWSSPSSAPLATRTRRERLDPPYRRLLSAPLCRGLDDADSLPYRLRQDQAMELERRAERIGQRTIIGCPNGSAVLAVERRGGSFHIARRLGSGLGSNTICASAAALARAGHVTPKRSRKSYYLSLPRTTEQGGPQID